MIGAALARAAFYTAALALVLIFNASAFDQTEVRSLLEFAALALSAELGLSFLGRSRRRPAMGTITTTTSGLECDGAPLDPVTTTSPASTPIRQHMARHAEAVCAALAAAGCSCDDPA